jgi:hypothetical protein
MTDANWIPIWRGLSVTLLREGFCSMKSVERWAKDNNWRLRSVSDVIKALAIESFEHEGDVYFRFSGKVVPL